MTSAATVAANLWLVEVTGKTLSSFPWEPTCDLDHYVAGVSRMTCCGVCVWIS